MSFAYMCVMQPLTAHARLLLTALSALLAAACVVSTEETGESDEAISARSFKIATFNAGLVRGGVALADERLAKIAPAVQASGADVVCMQEVWGDADYERIRGGLASTHPYAFRQKTEEDGRRWFSCNPFKLSSLKSCVDAKCNPDGVSAEACVQNACQDEYDALSDRCKLCLASNTDSPTSCLFRANEFVQEGRNGLAVFSRHPITSARFESYGTELVHRGLIRVTIEGRAIACTHMSSDLTTVPYPRGGTFTSWKDEQAQQVDKVAAALPQAGCRIALGDINASQGAGTIKPELESTIAGFARHGLRETWDKPTCTWCPPPANPLASGTDEKQYDHIFTAGCGAVRYKRILDKAVTVEHDGRTRETRLSDHFGLMAELPR